MFRRPALKFLLPSWSGLRSIFPWAVLLISATCSLSAWMLLRAEARERGLRAFELRAERLTHQLLAELRGIEQNLRSNAALLSANGPFSARAWRQSVGAWKPTESHPGVEAVGFFPVRAWPNLTSPARPAPGPAMRQAPNAPIPALLHPDGGPHQEALAFDLLSVPAIRTALARLAQGDDRATFVHPAPWLKPASPVSYLWMAVAVDGDGAGRSPEHTAAQGAEWVIIRLDRLVNSLLDHTYNQMDIELRTGGNPGSLLFDRDNDPLTPLDEVSSAVRRSVQLPFTPVPLTMTFAMEKGFLEEFNSAKSNLALTGGLVISMLLFLIAWYSATLSQRDGTRAREMTFAHGRVQARMQGIIGTAMDAIITVDDRQMITMFNRAAEMIFGYRADEVIGKPLDLLIPQEQRGRHRAHVEKFGQTGDTARAMGTEVSVNGLRANGEVFPIDASISRLKEGDHILYTVILRDITRRRQAEAALARTQTHLQQSNERLRQLSLHVETTREAERIRIAREIHDDLAATLTGIKMDLSAARDTLREDPARADLRLRASLGLMDAAVVTTRRIINDLRPSILDNLGVWAAIEWQAGETARRAGIRCEASVDPALEDVEVPPAVSTALFRIVQEALNNVWRHAGATRASVRCALQAQELTVEITDDGQGMEAGALQKAGHWGLLGMEERVRSHGGSITIESAPGQGTRILVRIPLPA